MKKIHRLFVLITFCFAIGSVSAGIKVATYNIRTFDYKNSYTNKAELKKNIQALKADFITVEEIVNASSFQSFIKKEFKNYSVYLSRCGGGGKQKVGFVFRKDKYTLDKIYEDNRLSDPGNVVGQYGCGRLRPALVGIFTERKTKQKFVVIGLHLKAGGSPNNYEKRAKQYDLVSRIVDELRLADYKNIIMMGDLNTTGFVAMDEDYTNFKNMLKDTGMSTSSENLKCTAYWSGTDRNDGIEESSVLDHIIYPSNFLGYKKKTVQLHSFCKKVRCERTSKKKLGISYKEVSDHCPVTVSFR